MAQRYSRFLKTSNAMNIAIPVGLLLIFLSLATAYYFNAKAKIKRNNRREKLKEMQDELLEVLRKKKEKD